MAEPKLLYIIEAVDDPDDLPLENVNVNSTAAERPRGQSPEDLLDGGEVGEQGEPGILLGPVATNEVASHASYETNREVTLSRGEWMGAPVNELSLYILLYIRLWCRRALGPVKSIQTPCSII